MPAAAEVHIPEEREPSTADRWEAARQALEDPTTSGGNGDGGLLAQIKSELAPLSDEEYEVQRRTIAKKHAIRTTWLDGIRYSMKPPAEKPGAGKAVQLAEDAPWPEPVDTASLLADIMAKIRRHVVLSTSAAVAVALYVVMTFCTPRLTLCALLWLHSPERRCGKTTLIEILARLVLRALSSASISAAALYRIVEAAHPTLLLDELDAVFAQKTDSSEALRGVINAGHTRGASVVYRCDSESLEVRGYDCFGPKVIAGIGRAPSTIVDRSIRISMTRKLTTERVDRFSALDGGEEFAALRSRLARWAADHGEEVGRARPPVPEELNDRAKDNWTSLIAVADLAGVEWSSRARAAALELSGPGAEEEPDKKIELLRDVFGIFERAHENGTDRLATVQIIEELVAIEEAPWAGWNKGKPITPRGIASLLKPFGIHSCDLRGVDGARSSLKGYKRDAFFDVWARFIRDNATNVEKPHEMQGFECRESAACRAEDARQDEGAPTLDLAPVADDPATRDAVATGSEGQKPFDFQGNRDSLAAVSRVADDLGGGPERIPVDLSTLTLSDLKSLTLDLQAFTDGSAPEQDRLARMPEMNALLARISELEGGTL